MQLPPPVHGVSAMNKMIHQSKLINSLFKCQYINLSTSKTVNDLQKKRPYKYFLTFKIICNTFLKLAFNRFDYVYITVFPYGPGFVKDTIIILLAKVFRQKLIVHNHSYGYKKCAARSAFHMALYKKVFKNTKFICLSELLVEDISTIYSGEVFILPNGVPRVNNVNSYVINKAPLTLLYLSNLIRGKGIYLVIEAMQILKKKNYNFKLKVVGPEGDVFYDDLKQIVKSKSLEADVVFVGPKFGEDKFNEYKQADIFLLPSDYDTFGLVLLDAMQFGVPCISSHINGIPDVLGDGRGVLIKDTDSFKLADAIEELANNEQLRKKISDEAFKYFDLNFTAEIFEERLAKILYGQPEKVVTV